MALAITLTGSIQLISYLQDGTLRTTQTCDGSKGTATFTLVNYGLAPGGPLTITDGAITYFDGYVQSVDRCEFGNKMFVTLGCQDDGTVDNSTPTAPFGLSNTPNGSTTFGYADLSIRTESNAVWEWGGAFSGVVTTYTPGLAPTQMLTITAPVLDPYTDYFDVPVRIERLTTEWLPGGAKRYRAEFTLTGLPARLVDMVTWDHSGTAFPATPPTGAMAWRTDLGMSFFYNGTRWLSTQLFTHQLSHFNVFVGAGITATTANCYRVTPPSLQGGSDLWYESIKVGYQLDAGTGPDSTNKWTLGLVSYPNAATFASLVIDSGIEGDWAWKEATIDALLTSTGRALFNAGWTKTGTPGGLSPNIPFMTYRIVAT